MSLFSLLCCLHGYVFLLEFYAPSWGTKAILRGFEILSSLKVNFYKSEIYGIKLCERSMNTSTFFLSFCKYHIPSKFLGVKVEDSPRRFHMWKDVINNVANRLSV